MPPKNLYGKYRSRRKPATGGGIIGDIGKGIKEVSKFVGQSGKTVTDVAAKVVTAGGKTVSAIGDTIKDKQVKQGFKTVGNTMSGVGKDVVNFIGQASPYVSKAGEYVGDAMMAYDPVETGGGLVHASLFEQMGFRNNTHAAQILKHLGPHAHHAMRSAAKFIAKQPMSSDDLPMLHHRPARRVGLKHFNKIASSTHESLQKMLKDDKSNLLHHAVQSSIHSATIGGGFDFNPDRYMYDDHDIHAGGGFFDNVGKELGKASVLTGKIGLAASPVVSLIAPELGVPMAAVSGAALGIGTAINDAYE